jgi:hypothetical protein
VNEPKRRGRPPKADPVGVTRDEYDAIPTEILPMAGNAAAQLYAERMWAGQSISLSRHERLGRIAAALQAQGMSMEGVTL